MSEPIISVSGLRGTVGRSLTPEIAGRYVAAFAAELPSGPVVLTRDGRATGRMLADAVSATLRAVGRTVIDADVAATPTTGVLVRQVGAAGGIQVSASHNPPEYNGIKLFNAEGRVVPAVAGQRVLDGYRTASPAWVEHDRIGRQSTIVASAAAHWQLIEPLINVEQIRRRKFHVLLDANHGAGSLLGQLMLDELNCEVTLLGGAPDGLFDHPPEPTAENLSSVRRQVVACHAHVGFCQDPDADRLAIIDEQGRYIGEEKTPAICIAHLLQSGLRGPIVTNCSTSRMSQDLAARYDVPFYRSAVGEANVVDVMCEHEALFGAEGNGGVIDPRVGLVRDSFVGMALVLDALAAREVTLSQLNAELPAYAIVKTKFPLAADKLPLALHALERHFADAVADRLDGLRLDWANQWLLVRGSNTEPVIRAIAEAPTEAQAQTLCDIAARVLAEQS